MKAYDLVIIGTGMGGGTPALTIASQALRVADHLNGRLSDRPQN